ncbi:hypothetical protein LJK87_20820 [Paenibacillus sp. P25]|nr:hypothetical protein LJK87_20820 [Paenibacillus sp. P25]
MRAVERAAQWVTRNRDEFERLSADMAAIRLMTQVYAHKVRAALLILTYKHLAGGDYFQRLDLLEEAAGQLGLSLERYRELTALTEQTYLYANSMQTPQRKVPIRGGLEFRHWKDCLPVYEAELSRFRFHLGELQAGESAGSVEEPGGADRALPRSSIRAVVGWCGNLPRREGGAGVHRRRHSYRRLCGGAQRPDGHPLQPNGSGAERSGGRHRAAATVEGADRVFQCEG